MSSDTAIDGVLIQWGERLFYPRNRIVKASTPRLHGQTRARAIRSRIEATVRRAPQVMVKVTGGGRGMAAIRAHFRYISKNGRLDVEDDRGVVERGKDAVKEIERQWQFGGAYIGEEGHRREAFNVMLSMPRGTDPLIVQKAAREFAKTEFADHRYVMVLHDHQANPHVHLSVKAASKRGERLNPRKADLHRWRETFAARLREWGIDAEATRQTSRGEYRNRDELWQIRAREDGRLRKERPQKTIGEPRGLRRQEALEAWKQIFVALAHSKSQEDQALAKRIADFVNMPVITRKTAGQERAPVPLERGREPMRERLSAARDLTRKGPEIER
ncbi:MAG TPA: conjugal transfer protein TraS [Caldimonas sp.]|nr:conjugal transfer protein TraS [Caldimonas sp.]